MYPDEDSLISKVRASYDTLGHLVEEFEKTGSNPTDIFDSLEHEHLFSILSDRYPDECSQYDWSDVYQLRQLLAPHLHSLRSDGVYWNGHSMDDPFALFRIDGYMINDAYEFRKFLPEEIDRWIARWQYPGDYSFHRLFGDHTQSKDRIEIEIKCYRYNYAHTYCIAEAILRGTILPDESIALDNGQTYVFYPLSVLAESSPK